MSALMVGRALLENMARGHLVMMIDDSGLSVEEFARTVVLREPQTVENWLTGKSKITRIVQDWLFNEWAQKNGVSKMNGGQ